MPDTIVKAALLPSLAIVLDGIDSLSGTTPKGAYAFGKQCDAVAPAFARYQKQKLAKLTELAKRDEHGKPLTQTVGNMTSFDFGEGFGAVPPNVQAALEEMNDEDVTLSGVRMVLVAELGTARLSPMQSRVLTAAKLLEDREPE